MCMAPKIAAVEAWLQGTESEPWTLAHQRHLDRRAGGQASGQASRQTGRRGRRSRRPSDDGVGVRLAVAWLNGEQRCQWTARVALQRENVNIAAGQTASRLGERQATGWPGHWSGVPRAAARPRLGGATKALEGWAGWWRWAVGLLPWPLLGACRNARREKEAKDTRYEGRERR